MLCPIQRAGTALLKRRTCKSKLGKEEHLWLPTTQQFAGLAQQMDGMHLTVVPCQLHLLSSLACKSPANIPIVAVANITGIQCGSTERWADLALPDVDPFAGTHWQYHM